MRANALILLFGSGNAGSVAGIKFMWGTTYRTGPALAGFQWSIPSIKIFLDPRSIPRSSIRICNSRIWYCRLAICSAWSAASAPESVDCCSELWAAMRGNLKIFDRSQRLATDYIYELKGFSTWFEQEQVCLLTCSCLTPAPNSTGATGDNGYWLNSCRQRKSWNWVRQSRPLTLTVQVQSQLSMKARLNCQIVYLSMTLVLAEAETWGKFPIKLLITLYSMYSFFFFLFF